MREWLLKDLSWKVFSVALATVIWLTVQHSESITTGPLGPWEIRTLTSVPVYVVSTAADVREFRVKPQNVEVIIRARPEVMSAVQEKEIHATVDLTDIESARDMRKRVEVSTPPGVTFVRANPAEVNVVVPPKQQ
jgi:YbbR domain-containing protein